MANPPRPPRDRFSSAKFAHELSRFLYPMTMGGISAEWQAIDGVNCLQAQPQDL